MKNKMRNLAILLVLSIVGMGVGKNLEGMLFQQPYSMPTAADVPFYVANARVDSAFFNKPNVISLTAARTLTAAESGSLVLLGNAAGFTVTLPPPSAGLYYDFTVTVSVTSGSDKIITDAGTTFLLGPYTNISTATGTFFECNGTTHIAFGMDGVTKGGLKGSWLRVRALTATLWGISGMTSGSGTGATACATS